MNTITRLLLLTGLWIGAASHLEGAQPNAEQIALANKAFEVLKKHCIECHGPKDEQQNLRVDRYDNLTKGRADDPNPPYFIVSIVANMSAEQRLDASRLWDRAGKIGDMPPESVKERPTAEEIQILKDWISQGAPKWQASRQDRPFVSELAILDAIVTHVRTVPDNALRYQRYLSLAHLHNNLDIDSDNLKVHRAALVKVINSLSRQPAIVHPRPLDPAQTVYNIDLRDLGWDKPKMWGKVEQEYPYGLKWNQRELAQRQTEISDKISEKGLSPLGGDFPYIRGDWFTATASRPPLYDVLLQLPDTQEALEKEFGINSREDFLSGRLARAAFSNSGVSKNNRLVDRHVGTGTRYFYISQDFGENSRKGNLFRFPLGPKFPNNPFNENHAFEQGGGEIIWRLNNGMQAYLIVDKDGKKIPDAPVTIVRDTSEISGSPVVVNGISCIGCHNLGVKSYSDAVRTGARFQAGEAFDKVDQLFIEAARMDTLIATDRNEFLRALKDTIGPYLLDSSDPKKQDVAQVAEPVKESVKLYNQNVDLTAAGFELGFVDPQELSRGINNQLLDLGLGPMTKGSALPRSLWTSKDDVGVSIFQKVAEEMRIATPFNTSTNN